MILLQILCLPHYCHIHCLQHLQNYENMRELDPQVVDLLPENGKRAKQDLHFLNYFS